MKKNILIIDDSALMRKVMSDIIEADSRFRVADQAVNGLEGLEYLVRHPNKYDAILLDINMPVMNGLEMLEELQKYNYKKKIIIVSTAATEGAKETIRALELGAFDFVKKPDHYRDVKGNFFRSRVLEALLLATGFENEIISDIQESKSFDLKLSNKRLTNTGKKIIALACSTGGPKALHSIIPQLPKDLNVPVLVVQHMPEGFTYSLSERLNDLSNVRVKEAADGEVIQNGVVYIAKGGSHMRVSRTNNTHRLSVKVENPIKGLMPCADLLYESLIESGYDEIICVVLTGMGNDATAGIKSLNAHKSIYVISQDEVSSVVYGMPRAIYNSGLVDEQVSLNNVIKSILNQMGDN